MCRLFVLHTSYLLSDCLVDCLRNASIDAESVDASQLDSIEALEFREGDILLLDLQLPERSALQIIKQFRAAKSPARIVLLVSEPMELLFECMSLGIDACVLERSSLSELSAAIDAVFKGEVYCSVEFANRLLTFMGNRTTSETWRAPPVSSTGKLTLREREVLALISARRCNKEIAKELDLSLSTVKNHVHNILEKLNVRNRVEAVDLSQREQMLVNN